MVRGFSGGTANLTDSLVYDFFSDEIPSHLYCNENTKKQKP